MAKIKVIVNGAKGRIGQETVRAIKAEPDLEIVGEADIDDDLSQMIKTTKAEVVVDFTHPNVRMQTVRNILNNGAAAVIGTTGFTDIDLKEK
jgi:4-hydroxy-tetrahydrodipicolinate reductase